MKNNQNENLDSELESLELEKEVKNESSPQILEFVENLKEIKEKVLKLEEQNKNTTTNAIKSIGYISVVISLGLTSIVSFLVIASNKSSFEWWQALITIAVIFIGMIVFFAASTCLIFHQTQKYTKINNKKKLKKI